MIRGVLTALILTGAMAPVAAAQETGGGTGFRINAAGWIVTNAHVVEGCASVQVPAEGVATVVALDSGAYLALLRVAPGAAAASLAIRGRPARLAETVVALGYPLTDILSGSVTATTGTVSALAGIEGDRRMIQISAPLQPGNSGGPILDDAGLVIGVATATLSRKAYDQAQNVNFAVAGVELLRFLDAQGVAYHLAEPTGAGPATLSDHAEAAAAATVSVRCHGAMPEAPRTATVPAPTAPVAGPPGMIERAGHDVIGFDYAALRDVGLPDCRLACAADAACAAYTYNLRHHMCFLKHDASLLVRNPDAVGGYAARLAGEVIESGFSVNSNVDAVGGDYARLRDTTFMGCFLACAGDTRCDGFAFVRGRRECWLKDGIGPLRTMPGVDFGSR